MAFNIVDARPEHLDRIEEIERESFSLPWTRQMLQSQMERESHVFLVAEDENGEVCGYVGLMFVLDEGYISNVAVDKRFRRMGAADALISRLEERSRAMALAFISLEVRQGNARAIALYEKHGFKPVGLRKNYYDKPKEDAVIMTLEF